MKLNRRIMRELKDNWVRYGALSFLIILSIAIVVGMAGATDAIFYTIDYNNEINNLEDGEFSVRVPLSEKQIEELEGLGIEIEEEHYLDSDVEDGSVIRVFKNRKNINKVQLEQGELAAKLGEIVLENHYAENHNIIIGDTLKIGHREYKVTGIGSAPDYSNVVQNISDVLADLNQFSISFVSQEEFDKLQEEEMNIKYNYSYLLNGAMTAEKLKDNLVDLEFDKEVMENSNMTEIINELSKYGNIASFLEAEDNQRITSCKDDSFINKIGALIAGIIIIILLAYMISVFVIHNIEKESSIIGALYSLGYVKKELLRHFMILPTIIVVASALLGTGIGFLIVPINIKDSVAYYSYPKYTMIYSPYLIIYGVLLPIIIVFLVNLLVINSKLSLEPLKLLRNEKKQHKFTNVDLKNMSFINRYRVRQLLREMRGNITMFFGLSIAILLMVFGFCIYGCVDSYVKDTVSDVNYNYLYFLKYPEKKVPENSYVAYTKSFDVYYDVTESEMEVTLQGIEEDNPYFDFSLQGGKKDVFISSSVASKFGYEVGDKIILEDSLVDKDYTFNVKGIENFASGLYMFMDIDNMRELFEVDEDYYNTLMSDVELDIEGENSALVITVDDIVGAAKQMYELMSEMIITIIGTSIILFIIVMYLLLKMMVDKSTFSISLIKVFGYNENEVKKIYLGSSFYTVVVTTIIAIPLSKIIINKVYPFMVSNVSAGMSAYLSLTSYLAIIIIIILSYLIVNYMIGKHLKKISLVEILKERE